MINYNYSFYSRKYSSKFNISRSGLRHSSLFMDLITSQVLCDVYDEVLCVVKTHFVRFTTCAFYLHSNNVPLLLNKFQDVAETLNIIIT
jgi:hypothetical protein